MSHCKYEQFFREADTDGSGELNFQELLTILRKKGYKNSETEIRRMFQAVDTSADGKISMNEYLVAMGQQPPEVHGQATMRRVFVEFDKNGDGTIDKAELKQVFKELRKELPESHINRMMELADKDSSGALDYNEFIAFCFGK